MSLLKDIMSLLTDYMTQIVHPRKNNVSYVINNRICDTNSAALDKITYIGPLITSRGTLIVDQKPFLQNWNRPSSNIILKVP